MKKQITAILCSAVICGSAIAAVSPRADADTVQYADELVIATYGKCGDMDITSSTEASVTEELVFNMIYDRLLEVDDNGYLQPSLLEYWNFEGCDPYGMSAAKSRSLCTSYNLDMNIWERRNYLPDLPDNPTKSFDEQGYAYPVPVRGWDEFLGGGGPLVIQLHLKEGLHDRYGTAIGAEEIVSFIYSVKGLDSDTLIYKQWQPVYFAEVADELTVDLYLKFADLDYGFMDFMYGLASPYGSILHIEGDELIGSGAYDIIETDSETVRLERNDDWWGGEVPTQYVTFKAVEDNIARYIMLETQEADIVFLDGENAAYDYIEYEFDYDYIATNPVIAFYNKDSYIMQDLNMRIACDCSLDNVQIVNMLNLSDKSNDFWTYISSYDVESVKWYFDHYGYPVEEIKVLCSDSNKEIAYFMQSYFNNSAINSYIKIVSDSQFKTEALSGNYDIVLADVDLYDRDSIYKVFNMLAQDRDAELEQILYWAHCASAEGSYFRTHYNIQKYSYNDEQLMTYIGWKNKVVARNTAIGGFKLPQGLYPLGDMCRIDLRQVYKTV